jgi:hypothetical protein
MISQEKLLLARVDKTAKLAKMTVQRNSLRGCDPLVVGVPNFLEKTSVRPPHTIQKDYKNGGTSPDLDGVNYVRSLKGPRSRDFEKGLLCMCLLDFW